MKALCAIVCAIALVAMWLCGIGTSISLIALVLKWCGVTFVSTMSAWLPVKFIGGWLLSSVVATLTGAYATLPKGN